MYVCMYIQTKLEYKKQVGKQRRIISRILFLKAMRFLTEVNEKTWRQVNQGAQSEATGEQLLGSPHSR